MSENITIKKDDLWKYSTIVLLVVLVVGGIIMFSGPRGTGEATTPTGGNEQPSVVRASIDGDPVLGDDDAPVTLFEFSDYQCPFCRRHYTQTYPLIKESYVDTGKVKIVFKDYPVPQLGHHLAIELSESAECARDQGGDEAYFKMHDKIYEEQNILDGGSVDGPVQGTVTNFNIDDIKSWANEIGYDISNCLDSGKYKEEVLEDKASIGRIGTPTFVIMKSGDSEGTPLRGAQPFPVFQQAIESML